MQQDPLKRYEKQEQFKRMSQVFVKRTSGGIRSWFKAQIILFFVSMAILMIGLYLLDISFWGLKAFLIAFIDGLPLLGSGIIMIPWAIIKLIGGQGTTAVWLIVIYLILLISRQVLEPIIFGNSIGLKPLWTFLLTIIGIIVLGPIGAIVGALAAIVIGVILTIREDYQRGYFNSDSSSSTSTDGRSQQPYGTSVDHTVDPRRYHQAKDAGEDEDLQD